MLIILRRDPQTGKQNIVVKLDSDPDALPVEHEQMHKKLVEKLKAIKKDNPDQRAITVMAEDSIQYENLVIAVDKCLEADLPDVSVSAAM